MAQLFCAGPLLPKPVAWREFIPPPVLDSWETLPASRFPPRADIVEAIAEGRVTRNLPNLPRGQALLFCGEPTVPFAGGALLVVSAVTRGTLAGSAGSGQ